MRINRKLIKNVSKLQFIYLRTGEKMVTQRPLVDGRGHAPQYLIFISFKAFISYGRRLGPLRKKQTK